MEKALPLRAKGLFFHYTYVRGLLRFFTQLRVLGTEQTLQLGNIK